MYHLAFDTSFTNRQFWSWNTFMCSCHQANYVSRDSLSLSLVFSLSLSPLQLCSRSPIRQRKLADCDPSATVCLNCSPSACSNERWTVYSGYALVASSALSLFCLHGHRSWEKEGFNDAMGKSYEGIRNIRVYPYKQTFKI